MAKRKIKYDAGAEPRAAGEESASAEESSVYARGQTVVPKTVREALGIEYGTRLQWEIREGVIRVTPIPQNPVLALRGMLKGTGLTSEWFLEQRRLEREKEQELEERWELRQRPAKRVADSS